MNAPNQAKHNEQCKHVSDDVKLYDVQHLQASNEDKQWSHKSPW